ncbi:PTS fructose transporter subunit IIBC [Salmonella enterica subsp. enterica]|uniref:PTS fructose transporter subunit IIBC n=1 Tax=Salmonella enterica I TaxID=59201 RepID=A0A379UXJ8_SALET|nr:PTS fructose transporter subunit IIBC [Salmonella enterica subsp. enterica]
MVIIAADIELDLSGFVGKRLYRTSTGAALKKSAQEMDNAFNSAEVYQGVPGDLLQLVKQSYLAFISI